MPARGDPATDRPLNRLTGEGWVAATADHDYADALRKQHPVTLLVVETTGAVSPSFAALLRTVGRSARAKGAADHTHYGTSRASPATFYAHHSAAISAAAVYADGHTILAEAAACRCL